MADLAALRAVLAREAARRARTGQLPGTVLPRLRLLTTAELLCPGGAARPRRRRRRGACGPVRRPGGRCCAAPPAGWRLTCPPGRCLSWCGLPCCRVAVLCWLRGALAGGAAAVRLCCQPAGGAAVLQLLGCGMAGDAAALWRRLAAEAGGHAVFFGGADGWSGGAPARRRRPAGAPVPAPADLLADRYSLPRLYLDGFCAEPER